MRGVYDAVIEIAVLNSARTVMYITAPSTKVVEVLSAAIENASVATSEQHKATFQKVTTLGTPTATTLTPSKHEDGDQAAASVVKGNCTSEPTTYAADTEVGKKGYSSVAGYFFGSQPEERLYITAGQTYGLRLLSTPTSFVGIVRITFREIG